RRWRDSARRETKGAGAAGGDRAHGSLLRPTTDDPGSDPGYRLPDSPAAPAGQPADSIPRIRAPRAAGRGRRHRGGAPPQSGGAVAVEGGKKTSPVSGNLPG